MSGAMTVPHYYEEVVGGEDVETELEVSLDYLRGDRRPVQPYEAVEVLTLPPTDRHPRGRRVQWRKREDVLALLKGEGREADSLLQTVIDTETEDAEWDEAADHEYEAWKARRKGEVL